MDEGDPNEQTKLNLQSERLHSLKQIELEKRLIFLPIGIKFTFFFKFTQKYVPTKDIINFQLNGLKLTFVSSWA